MISDFASDARVDLDLCASEPIHIPGREAFIADVPIDSGDN